MNISKYFGRINEQSNVCVFDSSGESVNRMTGFTTIYPIGSKFSCDYEQTEYPQGIIISASDAKKINLTIEK